MALPVSWVRDDGRRRVVGDREAALAEALADSRYLRERLEPRPGDPYLSMPFGFAYRNQKPNTLAYNASA